jgi:hypothetical protein
MKNRKNLFVVAAIAMAVMVTGFASCSKKDGGAAKQAETSDTVTLYNGNLKKIESSWTYGGSGDMVSLNFEGSEPLKAAYTFSFTDDPGIFGSPGLTAFREAVEKAIEWAAVAKENKVQDTMKLIGDAIMIPYLFNGRYTPNTTMLLAFYFRVVEWEGKNETLLLIKYDSRDPKDGVTIGFKEEDFKRLKKIFSDESLAEAKNKAQEKAKTEDLFE